jgi:hypothetical protein
MGFEPNDGFDLLCFSINPCDYLELNVAWYTLNYLKTNNRFTYLDCADSQELLNLVEDALDRHGLDVLNGAREFASALARPRVYEVR